MERYGTTVALAFELQYLDIDESPGSNKLSMGQTHRREDILALGQKLDRLPACTMIVLRGRAAFHAEDKMSGTTARQRHKIWYQFQGQVNSGSVRGKHRASNGDRCRVRQAQIHAHFRGK